MKRKTTRLCAMCDKVIPDVHIVCSEHMNDYRLYGKENWFKELVMAQRRQFEVDNIENFMASGKVTKPYQKLTDSEKQAIKFLRSKKLGAQSISKLTGINAGTIKHYIYGKSNSNRE